MKWMKWLQCRLWGHDEEIFRKREDQRYLIWVCKRCDQVTRQVKMTQPQMRMFRALRRIR